MEDFLTLLLAGAMWGSVLLMATTSSELGGLFARHQGHKIAQGYGMFLWAGVVLYAATADLPATARPVTDPAEREQVLAAILASLPGFADNPGQEPAVWVARSPLVEVTFGN